MILSYMNLLDNYDVKNVNYISQELDNVKFGPVFRESYDDDRKYNLNFIKKEILTHKNFLMDSWIDVNNLFLERIIMLQLKHTNYGQTSC